MVRTRRPRGALCIRIPAMSPAARVELCKDYDRAESQAVNRMQKLSITWLGHSTFIIRTPGGKRLLFDPWMSSNPSCPESMKKPPKVDLILVSHGHFDHVEDLVACARESGAPVVGIFELCDWLGRKGIANTSP